MLYAMLALSMSSSQARADIHFDQLSSCDSLERIAQYLKSSPSSCRSPSDELEEVISSRFTIPGGDGKPCFLSRPPTSTLSTFKCFVLTTPRTSAFPKGTRHISCVKKADEADLIRYKDAYLPVYGPLVERYLDAAAHCPAGNGDAAIANRNLMPFPLTFVARYSFGFVLPIGDQLVGKTSFIHGYGKVDPSLTSFGSGAIEFFAADISL